LIEAATEEVDPGNERNPTVKNLRNSEDPRVQVSL